MEDRLASSFDLSPLPISVCTFHLGFSLVVVEDCCSDQDPEVHDFLTQRIFTRQAEVVTSQEVIEALAGG